MLAFIRDHQWQVLAEVIGRLSTCTLGELPATAHAVAGSLGSYQLDAAFARVTALRSVLDDPASTEGDIAAARAAAVEGLRELQTDRVHESGAPS